ncbi:uncharacterized protein DDB_G0290685-like [Nilaparvata lugens]|uniref:uncharacterized protein DDB_G0290685-like n=1 Tax=Nilaparvata lugens TaxID=108931 RepID=UPI00193C9013|nr:uncharacterized protein DDB_G0290685-like [Nilaparvata lugens]
MTSQFGTQKNVERLEKMRTRPYFNEGAFERSSAYRSSGKQELENVGGVGSTDQQHYYSTSQYYQPKTAQVHMVEVSSVEQDKLQKEMMRKLEEMMVNMRGEQSAKMTSGNVKEFSHSYFEKSGDTSTSGADCDGSSNDREEIDQMFDLQNRRVRNTHDDYLKYARLASKIMPRMQTTRETTSHSVSTEEKKETYGLDNIDHSSYSRLQKRHLVEEPRRESKTVGENRGGNVENVGENEGEKVENVGENVGENVETVGENAGGNVEAVGENLGGNVEAVSKNLGGKLEENYQPVEGTPEEDTEENDSNEREGNVNSEQQNTEEQPLEGTNNHESTTNTRSKRSFLPGDYYPSFYEPPGSFDDYYRKQLRKSLVDRESNEIPFSNKYQEELNSFLSEPVDNQQQAMGVNFEDVNDQHQTMGVDFEDVNNQQQTMDVNFEDVNNQQQTMGVNFEGVNDIKNEISPIAGQDSDDKNNVQNSGDKFKTNLNSGKINYSEIQQLVKSYIEGLEVLSQLSTGNQGGNGLDENDGQRTLDDVYQQRTNDGNVIDYSNSEQSSGNDYYDKYTNLLNQATKDLYQVIFESAEKSDDQEREIQSRLDGEVALILSQVGDEMKKIVEDEKRRKNLYGDYETNNQEIEKTVGSESNNEQNYEEGNKPNYYGDKNVFNPVNQNLIRILGVDILKNHGLLMVTQNLNHF